MAAFISGPCPICSHPQCRRRPPANDRQEVECPNCGAHSFTSSALSTLADGSDQVTLARIAFGVRKLPPEGTVNSTLLRSLRLHQELPAAMERIDNLVRYLAENFAPGGAADLVSSNLRATVGAVTDDEVRWVLSEALQQRLVVGSDPQRTGNGAWITHAMMLTVIGWQRHTQLIRDGAGSRHAFMAMRFGDDQMNSVFESHLKPAVARTAFELRTVAGDHKTAGSIDNRMRVEIRTSRFLVCDLTHGNRGAYWEAGFAEGLGRPVFYTCRTDVLHDRQHQDHPHFDTAHQLIVAWDPGNPEPGMQELVDVIRATLPAEARMEDGPAN